MHIRCPNCRVLETLRAYSRPRSLSAHPSRPSRRPSPAFSASRRPFTDSAHHEQRQVAVIGGGITGLTTAYRLARDPSTHVTLYEKSSRLGGWLQSERVTAPDGTEVLFEYGPRTLRAAMPGSYSMLELLMDLGLENDILATNSDSPAACNRYIYYPDKLQRLPGRYPNTHPIISSLRNGVEVLLNPLFANMLPRLIQALWTERRDPSVKDESAGDFIRRVFGEDAADIFASAVFHGIYAGDIYKLSARALFPALWALEGREEGFVEGMVSLKRGEIDLPDHVKMSMGARVKQAEKLAKGSSVFTLRGGMGQLSDALVSSLRSSKNVSIKKDAQIKSISRNPDRSSPLNIRLSNNTTSKFDTIFSTTPSTALSSQLLAFPALQSTRHLASLLSLNNYAVTVMVVNLYYSNPNLLRHQGFGYLIPRTVDISQNPEFALGVIFASEVSRGQDDAPGTKLTVMMGGHWWDGWQPSDLPDEESGIEMAKSVLARHLQITEEPVLAGARLQRDAIPQYQVGHVELLKRFDGALDEAFAGKLKVAGAWYTGVGVNDCVRSARLVEAEHSLERFVPMQEAPVGSAAIPRTLLSHYYR
ncbi:oxygen-dependent protoporphyrinogen oxidase [Onygenales sp. PD_10]|nr:oxygen-dependent protoporphyrinogen oxidase [Onygenales sp. PD_10]